MLGVLGLVWLLHAAEVPPAPPAPAPRAQPPALLTPLWRDEPLDRSRVRTDPIPGIAEPSDLLLHQGELYTVSDAHRDVYRVRFDGPHGAPRRAGSWTPEGMPEAVDLEALAALPSGEVLVASETNGDI